MLHNLPNLFVFADELGSLFADSNYSWTEAEDFSQAEKIWEGRGHYWCRAQYSPIGCDWANESLRDPTNFSTHTRRAGTHSHWGTKHSNHSNQVRWSHGFLTSQWYQEKLDVTLFPETYNRFSSLIKEGGFYYLTGKIQERDGRLQMILAEAQLATNEKFWIQLLDHRQDKTILSILKNIRAHILWYYAMKTRKNSSIEGLYRPEKQRIGRWIKESRYENDLSVKLRKIREF